MRYTLKLSWETLGAHTVPGSLIAGALQACRAHRRHPPESERGAAAQGVSFAEQPEISRKSLRSACSQETPYPSSRARSPARRHTPDLHEGSRT